MNTNRRQYGGTSTKPYIGQQVAPGPTRPQHDDFSPRWHISYCASCPERHSVAWDERVGHRTFRDHRSDHRWCLLVPRHLIYPALHVPAWSPEEAGGARAQSFKGISGRQYGHGLLCAGLKSNVISRRRLAVGKRSHAVVPTSAILQRTSISHRTEKGRISFSHWVQWKIF